MKIHKDCKIELAASKDEVRYAIANPYLDMSESPVMVSTNGAIIAVVPVETEKGDKSGPVTAEALRADRKTKLGIFCDGELKVVNGPAFYRPDYQFPNWRQATPSKERESTFSVGLNIKLLWELCQAIGCETARLEFKDNLEGVLVFPTTINSDNHPSKPAANPDAYGVIMPTRLA